MKRSLKQWMPEGVRSGLLSVREATRARRDARLSSEEVFATAYSRNTWGGDRGQVWSGSGSHDSQIVDSTVLAVRRRLARHYIACDIVPAVVESNKARYPDLAVDFRLLNAITDPLPEGDVAFVRQVLQHLSNAQICAILPKLRGYATVYITEHYPDEGRQTAPNLDKVQGPGTRVGRGSGVYLTEPPFNIHADDLRLLLEVPVGRAVEPTAPGWLRTFEYTPSQLR